MAGRAWVVGAALVAVAAGAAFVGLPSSDPIGPSAPPAATPSTTAQAADQGSQAPREFRPSRPTAGRPGPPGPQRPEPAVIQASAPPSVPSPAVQSSDVDPPVPVKTAAAEPPPVGVTAAPPPAIAVAKGRLVDANRRVLTVQKDAVIGISLDKGISSETARVDDKVVARVSRDVNVDGRTAIPAGARLEGVVTLVARAETFRDRDRVGLRFDTLVLADQTRIPIKTDAIHRVGAPLGRQTPSAAQSGGPVLGGGRWTGPAPTRPGSPPAGVASLRRDARIAAGAALAVKLTAAVAIPLRRQAH